MTAGLIGMALLAAAAVGQAPSAPPAAPHIVLLVDTSDSMTSHVPFRKGDRTLLTQAAVALAGALRPDERVSVDSFGPGINISNAALRREELVAAVDALNDRTGGASPLWDALDAALRSLDGALRADSGQAAGGRAIIVVTDGRTTGNTLSFAEILGRLRGARVPVFFLCAERPKQMTVADPSVRLRQIAAATGGQYYTIGTYSGLGKPKPEEIRRAMDRALEVLREGDLRSARPASRRSVRPAAGAAAVPPKLRSGAAGAEADGQRATFSSWGRDSSITS